MLRLRLYYQWSQATLEHRSGVDQTTISRMERGQHPGITIKRLGAVLDALGVGEVLFDHPALVSEQTPLEIMLYGDVWARATREANRRLAWPEASEAMPEASESRRG